MTTDPASPIYKIVPQDLWAQVLREGAFRGAPVDLADGFIHFSAAHQVRETAAKHFAGQDDLLLVAIDPAALGEALRWEVSRGGDRFPHLYATFDPAKVLRADPLPLGAGGAHDFDGPASVIGALEALARPFLHALDPESGASRDDPCAARRAAAAGAPGRSAPWRRGVRPALSEPRRHRRRVRQECRGRRSAVRAGIRLRRDRHGHAAPAARQSASAPVPPAGGEGRHQPLRLQQRRPCGGPCAARRAIRARRHRRRQSRRQQGQRRPRRRLCRWRRGLRGCRELFHDQRVLAEHAGPARPAGSARARRSARPRHRTRAMRRRRAARCFSRSRRMFRSSSSTTSCASRSRAASMA